MAKGLNDTQKQVAADMIYAEWSRCKSDYDSQDVADLFLALDHNEYAFEVLKWAEPEDSTSEFLPSKD